MVGRKEIRLEPMIKKAAADICVFIEVQSSLAFSRMRRWLLLVLAVDWLISGTVNSLDLKLKIERIAKVTQWLIFVVQSQGAHLEKTMTFQSGKLQR